MLAIVCGTIYRYQNSFIAFSFEQVAPKEKALQKEKGRFFACAASATFEKVDKTIAEFVRTKRATNQNLKSNFKET